MTLSVTNDETNDYWWCMWNRDLGSCLNNVSVLWMARCATSDLDGIASLSSLRELYLAYNDIVDISPCSLLEYLQILDLEGFACCINYYMLIIITNFVWFILSLSIVFLVMIFKCFCLRNCSAKLVKICTVYVKLLTINMVLRMFSSDKVSRQLCLDIPFWNIVCTLKSVLTVNRSVTVT